jgi:NDP-sugar pyrophosphorylase family protein
MKAMILAAGKGTRMLPFTENKPKALLEVQGITLLEHTILYLKYYGVEEIIINIHHYSKQIIDFVKRNSSFGLRIEFSDESDELLDTGGGLYKARWFFSDGKPFVLTSSDVITNLDLQEMYRYHEKNSPMATLAVKHRKSSRDFLFDQDYRLCGWHNNTTSETRVVRLVHNQVKIAFSTIHILNPAIFDNITERGRFSIIDVYLRLAPVQRIMGFEHDQSLWFECGRIENLESLNQAPEIMTIYNQFHQSQNNGTHGCKNSRME